MIGLSCDFFYYQNFSPKRVIIQFCDVAQVTIINKYILPICLIEKIWK
jgi:hypothetical protein